MLDIRTGKIVVGLFDFIGSSSLGRKRVKDPKGNYKSFGFVTFQEPISGTYLRVFRNPDSWIVLKILDILGGEATSVPAIELPVDRRDTKPLKVIPR